MIPRRRFVMAMAAGTLAPLAGRARAQAAERISRVGYLFSFVPAQGRHLWEACRQGLRALGYVEGKDVLLEPRWADGDHERLPALVKELLALKVDVLVTAATPASRAARAATRTTPIVFVAVAEPVRAGLVQSLARPGGNVTGVSLLTPELSGRRLKLLSDIVPGLRRVVVLRNPANLSHDVFLEESRSAAGSLGLGLEALQARSAEEIDRAFDAAAASKADALIVFDDPVLWSHRQRMVILAARWRLPVMYGYREFADEGGLISYGPARPDLYRRTATYVDRILKGASPAELPVELPTKFELVVNLNAARALGLAVPQSILLSADEVIQ